MMDKGIPVNRRRVLRSPCQIHSRFTLPRLMMKTLSSTYYSCDIIEFGEGGMRLRYHEPVMSPGQLVIVDIPAFNPKCALPYPARVCWVIPDKFGGGLAGLRFWAWT